MLLAIICEKIKSVWDLGVYMNYEPINLADKFSQFSEHWSPKVIAQMNEYQFKLVKFQGEFVGLYSSILRTLLEW
jgi:hypothetical protein